MGINTTASTGARGAVRMGEETTYGVVVAPTHIIDFNTESLAATENIIESEAIREDRGRHKLIRGNLDVGGDIAYEQSFGGYGMLIRHALGDYIKCAGADGGIRARIAVAESEPSDGHDGTDKFIIECTPEASSEFTDAQSLVAVVYRDANNDLVFDDNSAAGHAYADFCLGEETYVVSVDAASITYTGYSTTAVTAVTVADTLDADGNLVAPTFNPSGGIVRFGPNRERYRYFEYTAGTPGNDDSVLYLEPADVATHGDPSANDAAIGAPSFAKATSDFTIPAAGVKLGAWVYEYNTGWPAAGVYTHHLERGRVLPVGLTIEVNRDAAIFLYSGMKVNTITWNYDANSIVNATVSLIGKQEYAMATLVADVIPGSTSITISDGTTFPTTTQGGGTITIGEETGITYTTKVDNADGTSTLSGIPATGTASVERLHLFGTNVDSRTTTEADIYTVDYDAQTTNLNDGATLTFSGGGTATLLEHTDGGATGSITFQMVSGSVPVDNETFVDDGDTPGDGTVDGTPVAVAVYSGNTSPLTAFESNLYIDGGFEEVLSASVTLNNNLNGDKFGLGSRFRFQLVEEQAVVEASITVEFDDGKNYVKFKEGTFFSLELKSISESSDSEIGTTGVLSGQYLFLPKCKFTGSTPNIQGTSFIQHDMPITAIVDDDFNTTDLTCVLVNNIPTDVEAP
jgi:hypothetical protein